MVGAAICVAVSLMGVDVGCKRMPDGSLQYIVQIEPHLFESIRSGEYAIESDIPVWLRDVRSYRVCVGTAKLPRADLSMPLASRPTTGFTRPEAAKPSPSVSLPGGRPLAVPDSVPRTLAPDPLSKPVQEKAQPAKQAAFIQTQEPDAHGGDAPKPAFVDAPEAQQTARPWLPLTLAVAGFCGSLGGNLYLGMLFWDARRRYRDLLKRRFRGSIDDRQPDGDDSLTEIPVPGMDDLDR